jgi:hypothetical protein
MVKIKPQKPTQGPKVKVKQGVVEINNLKHPVFCFKYLHKDYCLDNCTDDEKRCFISQIVRLSQMDWAGLQLAPKHGVGSEKIATTAINPNIPYSLTEDVSYLLAFRFDGLKAFVGYRNKFIFHVLFIDRDFTLYNHG